MIWALNSKWLDTFKKGVVKKQMKAVLISIVSALGALVAATSTAGCFVIFVDEPEMPKAMLNK